LSAAQVDVATLSAAQALDHFPFCAALVLRTGELVLPESPEQFIGDHAVRDLARRITILADDQQSAIFTDEPGSWPVRVEIGIAGESITLERRTPRGVELSDDVLTDLRHKFGILSRRTLRPGRGAALEDLVFGLDASDDVYADLYSVIAE
jgi:2-methylcitrate dehydratase PrpD